MVGFKGGWRDRFQLAGWAAAAALALHTAPAAATEGCVGQFSAALIRPLPARLAVALDVRDTTPMNVALAEAFKQGLAETGHPVPAVPNAALTVSYRVVGQDRAGADPVVRGPAGADRSWTDPTSSNAVWLRGGQTAALPGMPQTGLRERFSRAQPATLFLRAEVRAVGSEQVSWVGVVQCTLQSNDDRALAHQMGRLIGGTIGKRIDRSPI